ncbi:MAG: hypothetical protein IKV00_09460, partial [Clostridia bacterium]|nr:hypothetical protein [Clostridia bacterium]
ALYHKLPQISSLAISHLTITIITYFSKKVNRLAFDHSYTNNIAFLGGKGLTNCRKKGKIFLIYLCGARRTIFF